MYNKGIETINREREKMIRILFTEVSTKKIKSLNTEEARLHYGCGIMGRICKYNSKKFSFQPNGTEGWSFIEYGAASKIKEQLRRVREEVRIGRVIGS